jgi:Flp pilus assembly protein TadD
MPRRETTTEQRALRGRIDRCDDPVQLAAIADENVEDEPALAARAYRKAAALAGEDGVILNNLGVACWNLGNKGEARDAFRRAAVLLPADRNILENLAGVLVDLRREDEARACFRRAAGLARGRRTLRANVDLHGY